ncbi:ninja-family protein AFP3-like isoform X2 [Quercus robur]|uniref:ninja-family protein AFP3-like isoform X2 n=1 Tax=Quercus robur TaxID=38942 RepID=UPI00216273A7|nr:ninja-family protein AFP3-like isoform X2 [Quercus robur]
MAQAENIGSREISRRIPMQMRNFPRDLLPRIMAGNHFHEKMEVEEGSEEDREEIELSLGLSLNGRFGVDPERAKKLMRSSSIPDFVKEEKETTCVVPMACAPTPLIRTCSLPTETEEQWRKRKELQSLRRLEAKRKRSEKQRNWKDKRVDNTNNNNNISSNNSNDQKEKEQCVKVLNEFSWGCEKGNGLEGFSQQPIPLSQGSIGSQGSASSGISESESQPSQPQGMNKCIEVRSPTSAHSTESDQKPPLYNGMTITEKSSRCAAALMENQSKKPTDADKGVAKEIVRNVLEDMPCVSTKGDGPNGKRIEGFLYRYRKGEEVRIVCVCHGSFLTPAEFVKHAGGGDVAHPLKHIVVNPTPIL